MRDRWCHWPTCDLIYYTAHQAVLFSERSSECLPNRLAPDRPAFASVWEDAPRALPRKSKFLAFKNWKIWVWWKTSTTQPCSPLEESLSASHTASCGTQPVTLAPGREERGQATPRSGSLLQPFINNVTANGRVTRAAAGEVSSVAVRYTESTSLQSSLLSTHATGLPFCSRVSPFSKGKRCEAQLINTINLT